MSRSNATDLSPKCRCALTTLKRFPPDQLAVSVKVRKGGRTTSHCSNGFPDCYSFSVEILRLYICI